MRVLVCAVLAGCYSPTYSDCTISCERTQLCPSGYHCSTDGYCTSSAGTTCRTIDARTNNIDGEVDAPYPTGPWTTPTPIEMNTTAGELDDDPSVTADGSELYFNRAGQNILMMGWNGAWSAPTVVPAPISNGTENGPFISADGKHLYFDSTRIGGVGGRDLWMASRTAPGAAWDAPVALSVLNSQSADEAPWVSPDETTIIFDSDRPPATRVHFWIATRPTANDPWGTPQMVNGPPDGADIYNSAHLASTGLVLYMTTQTSTGSKYLSESARTTTGDAFQVPTAMDGLVGSGNDDEDPWVSPDGHTVYFGSNRANNLWGIYTATR